MAKSEADVPQWTLGDRMRKAREVRGIRPGQMAEIMLRDRNTITNYEKGNTRPPRNVLARWAEVTGIPLEWIIGDSNPFDWRTPPPRRRGRLLRSNRKPFPAADTARYTQTRIAA